MLIINGDIYILVLVGLAISETNCVVVIFVLCG